MHLRWTSQTDSLCCTVPKCRDWNSCTSHKIHATAWNIPTLHLAQPNNLATLKVDVNFEKGWASRQARHHLHRTCTAAHQPHPLIQATELTRTTPKPCPYHVFWARQSIYVASLRGVLPGFGLPNGQSGGASRARIKLNCNLAGPEQGHVSQICSLQWAWEWRPTNKGHQEACSNAGPHPIDEQLKAGRPALLLRLPTERVLCLGHADGQVAEAQLVVPVYVLVSLIWVLHGSRAIHLFGNDLDLLLQASFFGQQLIPAKMRHLLSVCSWHGSVSLNDLWSTGMSMQCSWAEDVILLSILAAFKFDGRPSKPWQANLDGKLQVIEELELGGRAGGFDDSVGQVHCTLSAQRMVLTHHSIRGSCTPGSPPVTHMPGASLPNRPVGLTDDRTQRLNQGGTCVNCTQKVLFKPVLLWRTPIQQMGIFRSILRWQPLKLGPRNMAPCLPQGISPW